MSFANQLESVRVQARAWFVRSATGYQATDTRLKSPPSGCGARVLTEWSAHERIRPTPSPLLLVIAAIAAAVALVGVPAPTAQAFDPPFHERIVRDALTPDLVDNTAMIQILAGPPPGIGAIGSDLSPAQAFRHFDNAKNPADICTRARDAWNFYIPAVTSGARPAGPGFTVLVNGPGARSAFGGLAHALADFYSHSNWVELNAAAGQPEQTRPPAFPHMRPSCASRCTTHRILFPDLRAHRLPAVRTSAEWIPGLPTRR